MHRRRGRIVRQGGRFVEFASCSVYPMISLQAKEKGEGVHNVRLCPVDSIKSLVQEQANGPRIIHPWRAVLVESGIVPEQGEEV